MSQESSWWLNNFVLVGFTENRKGWRDPIDPGESRYFDDGKAWHFRADLQGAEENHYAGAIPLDDVIRRLFSWKAEEKQIMAVGDAKVMRDLAQEIIQHRDGYDFEAVHLLAEMVAASYADPERKIIVRPRGSLAQVDPEGGADPGGIMGVFKSGYQGHDYEEWLLKNVRHLFDDADGRLGIGSAGLLKMGAQAFVSVEMPDWITTKVGVVFKPRLLAVTSFDGSLSTTYKLVAVNAVCDNTMRAGLREDGEQIKVKHSRYSDLKVADARQALGIMFKGADAFADEVDRLADVAVSDGDWEQFLDKVASLTDEKTGKAKEKRSLTLAENKRAELNKLWNHDVRVAPWRGSAWGVVQAMNTYVTHEQTVRGKERAERNMDMAVTGGFDKLDAETMATLAEIVSLPEVAEPALV